MKDTNNYSTIALVAIIAIVAIVAVLSFVPGNSGNNLQLPANTALVQQNTDAAAENLAGEAFARSTPTTKTEYVSKTTYVAKPPTSRDGLNVRVVAAGDNQFAIYHKDAESGEIIFDGKDEDANDWQDILDIEFTADPDDYFYFAAWDDGAVGRALMADIYFDNELAYSTNDLGDWEVYETDLPPAYSHSTDYPSVELIQSLSLEEQQFNFVANTKPNGASPWGMFSSLSEDARWIWGNEVMSGHIQDYQQSKQFMLFRVKIVPPSYAANTITGYAFYHPNGVLTGIADVDIVNEDGQLLATTSADGSYSFGYTQTYTDKIHAEKGSWIFYPEERVYVELSESLTEQNFVGCDVSGLKIMGTVTTNYGLPVKGLQMQKTTADGGSDTKSTVYSGKYTFSVPFGWSGMVAPADHQCVDRFVPVSRSYTDLWADQTQQDYTAFRAHEFVHATITWNTTTPNSFTWNTKGKDCFSRDQFEEEISNGNLGKGGVSTFDFDDYYKGDTVTITPKAAGYSFSPAASSCTVPCSMAFTSAPAKR